MRKISASNIFPVNTPPIKNGVVIADDNGIILDVLHSAENLQDVEFYEGFICPGFVNTHCHLELSHLKGKIKEGNGLVTFIKELTSQRNADNEVILRAIAAAENEMINNGIVAVGDISNGPDTFEQKLKGNIYYHTFIELYGFLPGQAKDAFQMGIDLTQHPGIKNQNYSIVPHSPYAVSADLFSLIKSHAEETESIISIHNEETLAENELFIKGKGNIIELMRWFNIDTSFWKTTKKSSLKSVFDLLPKNNKMLLVHNTFTTKEEIEWVENKTKDVYWCFCPNANWYIERKLPNIPDFMNTTAKITLGTDSLSSNHELSILSEIQRIAEKYPEVPLATLLKWGTRNGAEFLGIENIYGTFEKGKMPGINLIEDVNPEKMELTSKSKVRKLI